MELNLLKIGFSFMTFHIAVVGCLINTYEKYLPVFITETFRYGKFSYSGVPSNLRVILVPKRWFQHFYVFSSIFSLCVTFLAVEVFYYGEAPFIISKFLDLIATSNRKAGSSSTAVLVALCLLCLQTWRRLYETTFVSVFSDSQINIFHYIVGFVHYGGAVLAVLAEAPGFTPLSFEYKVGFSLWDIDWVIALGTFIFLWAWYHQFLSALILANLRKNKTGAVVTLKHGLPQGDLFEFVSSPHLLCEMLMYFGLWLILWGNSVWPYVFFWVLSNQMETALLSHWWYLSEFRDYPKERKAFIPYLL
ncbi:polyprenal reductase [Lycorma delicatula]|uniref:polyprenal reductase n=1 Tax=Lycorma delicatula TaxID=130591 RepID=UPI003F51639B